MAAAMAAALRGSMPVRAMLATVLVLSYCPALHASRMTWEGTATATLTETMFKRTKVAGVSQRPYIEFRVFCEEPTEVSWILVAAKDCIGVHNRTFASGVTGSCETRGPLADLGLDPSVVYTSIEEVPCNETLTIIERETIDGTPADEPKSVSYCCDVPVNESTMKDWTGSHILYAAEYRDRFIAGHSFKCSPEAVSEAEQPFKTIRHIPYDGHYTLFVQSNINPSNRTAPLVKLSGYVEFVNLTGKLSAAEYPLLVFYGCMGLFYLFLGIGWVIAMGLHYQDLLRLQFWLSAIIFLGMVEFAFAYGDLDWINSHGTQSTFLFVMTQLLHAGKSTTARILVLVVSMGYGVVKPRLGAAFKQIVVFGVLYMSMASLYGITHIPPSDGPTESKYAMMAVVPLSVLDAGVLWWIFFSLHHTMKILALRQNTVKLVLYQRFRLLLAFFAIAAILFFGWTLYNSWDTAINHAWENSWLLEAFQHILFSIVLIGILILWRPSMNNSRYAYAALETDLLEDEDYQVVPNFGHETMTARTKSSRGLKPAEPRVNVEDELAWVEENIPSSVLSNDNTLASLQMDSDEDIMETRILMNKME